MKSLKALLLLFLSLLFTGCYTQLQYSQQGHRITDQRPVDGYAWSSDSDDSKTVTDADSIYMAETKEAKPYDYGLQSSYASDQYEQAAFDDEYLPIAYTNYDVVEKYNACQCDPYKTYVLVDDPYYFPSYRPYSYYYRHYPPYRSYFGMGFYNHGFAFSVGWSSHYHAYYNPFYYPPHYYDYAWWYPSVQYHNYYFLSNNNVSYAYKNPRRRDGRRSIGAGRVGSKTGAVNRARSTSRGRTVGVTKTRSRTGGVTRINSGRTQTKVTRTRSKGGSGRVGTQRSRSSSRAKVNVSRSRTGGGGTVRTRGTSTVTRTKGKPGIRSSVSRSRLKTSSGLSTVNRTKMRTNLRKQRVTLKKQRSGNTRSNSFFRNFGKLFKLDPNAASSTRSRSFTAPRKKSGSGSLIQGSRSTKKSSVRTNSSKKSGSKKRSRSSGGGKKRSRGGN